MANPYSAETNMFVGAPATNTGADDSDDLFAGLDTAEARPSRPAAQQAAPSGDIDPFAPPPPPPAAGKEGQQAQAGGGGGGGGAYDSNPWDTQGFLQTGAGSGADGYYAAGQQDDEEAAAAAAPPPPVAAAVPIEDLAAAPQQRSASPAASGATVPLGQEASAGEGDGDGGRRAARTAEEEAKERENSGNFCKLAYYQKYFAVETADVFERLKWSLTLTTPRYMKKREERDAGNSRPDMYGPLWVTTTLWVVLAVCYVLSGALSDSDVTPEDSNSAADEMFNFKWVLTGMAVSYSYTYLVPLLLWCILKYKDINELAMTKLICVYGYALLPFVLGSLFTVVPVRAVQVLTIVLLSAYSFAIIAKQLWPFTASFSTTWKVGFVGFLVVAHGVATIFLYYEVLLLSASSGDASTSVPAPLPTGTPAPELTPLPGTPLPAPTDTPAPPP